MSSTPDTGHRRLEEALRADRPVRGDDDLAGRPCGRDGVVHGRDRAGLVGLDDGAAREPGGGALGDPPGVGGVEIVADERARLLRSREPRPGVAVELPERILQKRERVLADRPQPVVAEGVARVRRLVGDGQLVAPTAPEIAGRRVDHQVELVSEPQLVEHAQEELDALPVVRRGEASDRIAADLDPRQPAESLPHGALHLLVTTDHRRDVVVAGHEEVLVEVAEHRVGVGVPAAVQDVEAQTRRRGS